MAAPYKYFGPFTQLLTMRQVPLNGPIGDHQLEIQNNAGILVRNGKIESIGDHGQLEGKARKLDAELHIFQNEITGIPGLIDAHTHICFGGNRAKDYAQRNSGKTYLEIAEAGGGIWDTVQQTRSASLEQLVQGIRDRALRHLKNGVTTLEVKSGYGLTVSEELKMLTAINQADSLLSTDLIPTCLAAHTIPRDHQGTASSYLELLDRELLPEIKEKDLSKRLDIFIEKGSFTPEEARPYLEKGRAMGFDITIHADQFSVGGSALAVEVGAVSADHLEASGSKEIELLGGSHVTAVALPGASMGLGCNFTPARRLLDKGASLAIASDHNPGSAPMGELLMQAAVLGSFEKLSNAEVLAGITTRAANALRMEDRGILAPGKLADIAVFPTADYREILYYQGSMRPSAVIKAGTLVFEKRTGQN